MDIELYFEERGAGTPLLLLHGNGESGEYFVHQKAHFSKFCHVIAPDTRGHGKSPRGTGPFSIARFADDLKEFMDGQDMGKAIILGFSDGANIAMSFALKYPERVLALILNGGNLDPIGVKRRAQLPIELVYRMSGRFAGIFTAAKKTHEMMGLMVNEPDIHKSELAAISVPSLVIAGTRDLIKESHTRLICDSIPGAELAFIEGDHFVAGKEPEAFNAAVEAFLRKNALISE